MKTLDEIPACANKRYPNNDDMYEGFIVGAREMYEDNATGIHFRSICPLLMEIPIEVWEKNDAVKIVEKLADSLEKEGYVGDAMIVKNHLKYVNMELLAKLLKERESRKV